MPRQHCILDVTLIAPSGERCTVRFDGKALASALEFRQRGRARRRMAEGDDRRADDLLRDLDEPPET